MRVLSSHPLLRRGLLSLLGVSFVAGLSHGQAAVTGMAAPGLPTGAVDAGVLPGTQAVTLTLYLLPAADRRSALDSFLVAVGKPGAAQYRQWVTPASFAQSFGATADQVSAVQAWATAQGLIAGAVSASGTYLTITGTAAQIESTLAPGLHAVGMNGQRYLANTAVPTLPAAVAADVLAISGLNTVPAAHSATLRTEAGRAAVSDLLAGVSAVVEANSSRLLSIASTACVEDVDAATAAAMHLLLKEAAAEGMTTLAASGCNGRGSASYPGGLAEAVSVAVSAGITPGTTPTLTELRPDWQSAPGLPQDGFRYEPDLTVSSQADMENAVLAILSKQTAAVGSTGSGTSVPARLGNMAGTLYAMGPIPDLYKQPDGAAAGTWEAATGLGITDLGLLVKKYSTGTNAAQVSFLPVSNTSGSNLYAINYGYDATYKIAVTGAQGVPSGTVTVTFAPGGYSYTAALAADGTGTFLLDELATQPPAVSVAGTEYQITATYNGDNTYIAGANGEANLYVNPAPVTITANAASTSGTLFVGGPYLVAVTLSAGPTSPTGAVTITPSFGTAQTINFPQNGSNNVSATFTATVAGTITIQAVCTAVTNYVCNIPGNTSVSVNKATPGVSAITVTNATATTATLSATVTGSVGATAPSGQVTFTANNTVLCMTTNAAAITGPVSCQSTNFPGTTSVTVTATYGGDTNYNSASNSAASTSSTISTTTTLAAIASPVAINATINLVATIAPASTLANQPPSGTITFFDGTTKIAQQTVANSQTSYTASVMLTTAGTHSITATYSGDTNYATSTSAAQSVVVAAAASVVLTASPTGSVSYGNNITLTAAISATPNNGASTLAGSIKFNVNGTDSVTQTVALASATGTGATAVFPITQALDVGTYTVNLYCTGTNFDCSNFNTAGFSFMVVKANTTTTLQVMPATFTAGQSIYASAIIAPAAAATGTNGVIGGTVTFFDNAINLGSFSVYVANGQYLATTSPFNVSGATDNIVAVYNGDGNNNSSKSTGSTSGGGTGTPTTTGITVSASPSTALSGAAVKLIATVTTTPTSGSTSAASASGTVNFYDTNNGTQFLVQSVALSTAGANTATATYSTSALPDGTNVITAAFVASSSYAASSTATGSTVQITDYTVAFTPSSLSLTAGQSGKVALAVNPVNGFSGSVALGCTPPSGSAITCTFDNATVAGASGLRTMTVGTTVRAAVVVSHTAVEAELGAAGALLLGLLLPAARRRRLRLLGVTLFAVMGCVLGATMGCTNIVNGVTGSGLGSGTPAGTEVVTVTATGTDGVTTATHKYYYSVNVQ